MEEFYSRNKSRCEKVVVEGRVLKVLLGYDFGLSHSANNWSCYRSCVLLDNYVRVRYRVRVRLVRGNCGEEEGSRSCRDELSVHLWPGKYVSSFPSESGFRNTCCNTLRETCLSSQSFSLNP